VSNFQIKTIETWTILGAFLYLQTVLFMGILLSKVGSILGHDLVTWQFELIS